MNKERFWMFILAAVVGQVLQLAHLPIPFMLGGILAGTLLRFTVFPHAKWERDWRNVGLVVAGYGIGRSFTRATIDLLAGQLPGVVGATVAILAMSVAMANFTFHRTRSNLISCVIGLMPGGMNQMMYMADEDPRVDANVVVVQQTLRLIGVIVSVPFLVIHLLGAQIHEVVPQQAEIVGVPWAAMLVLAAGAFWLAARLHIPTPALVGPILATAIFSCLYNQPLQPLPAPLMNLAQLSIGLFVGSMLDKHRLYEAREQVPYALVATVAMIGVSIAMALFLSSQYHFTAVTAFLAMAPGGVGEMCMAGLSMDEDVSIILTYQIVRMMTMNVTIPYALQYWFGKHTA